MSTPNLNISLIASNQTSKEIVANSAFTELDEAMNSRVAITMTDADYTLATAEGGEALGNSVFVFTGTLTAGRNVIVPTNKKHYTIVNNTAGGHAITVKTPAGTGIAVAVSATDYVLLYCDGTNVVLICDYALAEKLVNKNAASGYCPLDGSVLVPAANLPTTLFTAAPVGVPGSSAATGVAGTWSYDSGFLYVCYATNQWSRIAYTSTSF